MSNGLMVKNTIEGAHFRLKNYPLFEGDILVKRTDGTFMKVAPGLAIGGFTLSEEEISELAPVEYSFFGLNYTFKELAENA